MSLRDVGREYATRALLGAIVATLGKAVPGAATGPSIDVNAATAGRLLGQQVRAQWGNKRARVWLAEALRAAAEELIG